MNGLSFCSGIVGLDLGLHLAVPGYRTVCYVELEPYPQDILLARMADGVLDRAPIWGDLKRFDASQWRGLVDVVHGGYPCQPFSVAGKRAGADDSRHLWPHVARVVADIQPTYCFFENVAGHLSLGFPEVAADLESMGYRVSAGLFTAAEVGAPHRRQRLYILAHRNGGGCVGRAVGCNAYIPKPSEPEEHRSSVGHPDDPRLEGRGEPEREGPDQWAAWPPGPEERDRWAAVLEFRPELAPAVADTNGAGRKRSPVHVPVWQSRGSLSDADGASGGVAETEVQAEPAVCRVADGLPHRVDRLKALGNAVVPDVAALAWRTLRAELT